MKRHLPYWILTGLFCFAMTGSGLLMLTRQPPLLETFARLGLTDALIPLIGLAKLAGVAALLAPGLPRLKEWAYAGFVINFTGAVWLHVAAGDAPTESIAPLVLAALALGSWATRPPARRLPSAPAASLAYRPTELAEAG